MCSILLGASVCNRLPCAGLLGAVLGLLGAVLGLLGAVLGLLGAVLGLLGAVLGLLEAVLGLLGAVLGLLGAEFGLLGAGFGLLGAGFGLLRGVIGLLRQSTGLLGALRWRLRLLWPGICKRLGRALKFINSPGTIKGECSLSGLIHLCLHQCLIGCCNSIASNEHTTGSSN